MPPMPRNNVVAAYLIPLAILLGLALWIQGLDMPEHRHQAGWVNFSLGFVLLAAYLIAQILRRLRLPLISGYILAGVFAGPYVTGLLRADMVEQLRLVDDLALSFIALSAGNHLRLAALRARQRALLLTIFLITLVVFALVALFVIYAGGLFAFTQHLTPLEITGLGILLGVIAVARSPSSAIAIINECRAEGPFTETVLGVTVVMDVLIIIFFTIALAATRAILAGSGAGDMGALGALIGEIGISLILGFMLGKGISWYVARIGHDLPLFLLFLAFATTKISLWLSHFMESTYAMSLHLEPLLICMSAGFTVQNFSPAGHTVAENLENCALPIFVLFFSLAGAALDFNALLQCWPFALCLAGVRAVGIFIATRLSVTLCKDPPLHGKHAWMAYLTQAGVAIGLAKLVGRQSPEISVYLTTVVLAVITINQIVGPITFKTALYRVGEAKKKGNK